MLRKTMIALCAAASVVALTPNMALAFGGGHGGGGGRGGGGGFGGGGGGHGGFGGGGFGGHAGFAAHSFNGGSMNSFARAAPNAAVGAGAGAFQGNRFAAGANFAHGNWAHGGFHHGFHHRRFFFAGGFVGPGYYDDYWGYPDYAYNDYYYDNGGCYIVHRRVHTPYGWRIRPVQVCG